MNKKFVQKVYKGIDQRLDLAVSEAFEMTRSQAQKNIKDGKILLNDSLPKAKECVKEGDKLTLNFEKKAEVIVPKIIFEDDDILVIDKPSGISTHPAPGESEKTLTEIFVSKLDFKEVERPGVVHRLDKGTSGVIILAKNSESLAKLQKEFQNRNVRKVYLALIEGQIQPPEGVINMPIERDSQKKEKMTVTKQGKEAITEFKTLKKFPKYSLLELHPKTGRTHQIRVHLSALGYPIVGDLKYGRKTGKINRIFLHAKEITIRHPKTEKLVTYSAKLASELEDFLGSI